MTTFTQQTIRAAALAAAAVALLPAGARAASITHDGATLVVQAAPGEANSVTLSGEEAGRLTVSDEAITSFPADRCTQIDVGYGIHCDVPARVRVELGDGADRLVVSHTVPAGLVVDGFGGDGDDELKAIDGRTTLTLDGGAGRDRLRSEEGADTLRGGPGDDVLEGFAGADVLEGGPGDDTLTGDGCGTAAPDVLDGGAGHDLLTDWGDCGPGADRRPVTVTVNGVADDGRPGEGDDVRDLDRLQLFVPATVVGGDGSETIEIFAPAGAGPSSVEGRGGDDTLTAGSGDETLDGGAGADRVEGGFGHDTLTGGPGRDVLHGDATSAQCGGSGQSYTIPFGNDVIQARDGEADTVDCGAGQDRVVADAVDVVAADCELVERGGAAAGGAAAGGGGTGTAGPGAGGAGSGGAGGAGAGAGGAGGAAPVLAAATTRLRAALAGGLLVRLRGLRPGVAATVVARRGGVVVARGRGVASASGTAAVRVRFTAAARRALAGRRAVTLTLAAGTARRTVTLRR